MYGIVVEKHKGGSLKSMDVQTKQQRIAQLAKRHPGEGIKSLNHYIDVEWLHEAYRRTRKDGAAGIDEVTSSEYETDLDKNLQSLLQRFKSGRYYAPAVKRGYVPKNDEEDRPIGIPCLEDKVLQRAICMVLEPIFEVDFLECSYGFRPKRSVHQAIEAMWHTFREYGSCWVLEVDIRKYFDSIKHEHLRTFYKQRVCDGVIRRVLGKWLKAGVMEDGAISYPVDGTPQGGVISPLLSNIYLHNVVDEWFERDIQPRMCNRCRLLRFADDLVIIFESKYDAQRVMAVLPQRFSRYGLTLHAEKTRLVEFSPPGEMHGKGRTFDFLGFTHYWGKSRKGNWIPKRKTAKERLKRSIGKVYRWCEEHRHEPVEVQWKTLCRKVHGHYNFYGVSFNLRSINMFFEEITCSWQKWLNRRNREDTMPWEKFSRLLVRYPLPRPRIVHSYVT